MLELNEQQEKFVDYYVDCMDGAMSAKKAGYPKGDAVKIALDLLCQPEIQEAIRSRRDKVNEFVKTVEFTKEDLIRIYWNMYSDCLAKGKPLEAKNILNDIAKWNGVEPDKVKREIANLNFNLDGDKI